MSDDEHTAHNAWIEHLSGENLSLEHANKELQAFIYKQSLDIERKDQKIAELEGAIRWMENQMFKDGA